jgi:hypothetical protein
MAFPGKCEIDFMFLFEKKTSSVNFMTRNVIKHTFLGSPLLAQAPGGDFENCKHEEFGDQACRPSEINMTAPQNTTNCHACLLPISDSHHTFLSFGVILCPICIL